MRSQSSQPAAMMRGVAVPSEPECSGQQCLPLVLQQAIPVDEPLNDCAAGAREVQDRNNASHAATMLRPWRELYFVPNIPLAGSIPLILARRARCAFDQIQIELRLRVP